MRKAFLLWITIPLALLVALGVGIWAGAAFHDRISLSLGGQPGNSPTLTQQMAANGLKQLWGCSMNHPLYVQDHPGKCPICKMELTPMQVGAGAGRGMGGGAGAGDEGTTERKILYYWDPMLGPSSISKTPGTSAMGMDLVPVYSDEVAGGSGIRIDPAVVQNMGVQTAVAATGPLEKTVRTVGYLDVPEDGLHEVTLKVNGYINKLYANKTGMHVHKGDPLFDLYSPEVTVAAEELIAARKAADAMSARSPEVAKQAQALVAGARRKLQLWDIADADIDAIASLDHAPKDITIRSAAEGHLTDKMVVEGAAVQAGMKLMRIEDHRTLWLEAQVYEGQLPLVKVGQTADAVLDAAPGSTFSGKITFINPHLDHMTRTTDVRIELENPEFALKPGMYATVQIHTTPVADAVLVPTAAVIDTGTRQMAFIDEGQGHFSPRIVTLGMAGDNDRVQVLSGIAPGEVVVTSGQFLMDVESRRQEAAQKFLKGTPTQPVVVAGATTTMPEAVVPAVATTGESDGVVRAYLAVAEYLQQEHADKKPADVSALVQASGALAGSAASPGNRSLAESVKDTATLMEGATLEQQYKSFEKVGGAMVELIEKDPPSAKVAASLYVVNCVMENADWVQTSAAVTNPFLPAMRTCGTVTRTWRLQPLK